jgi:hypothetical protein
VLTACHLQVQVWEQHHILGVKLCGTLHVDLVLRVWMEAESCSKSNTVLIKDTTTVRSCLCHGTKPYLT